MYKILVVEDEPLLRDSYKIVLSTQPYHIDVAANGKEALEKTKAMTYDLILLDLMMPIIDGPGFLEKFAPDEMTKVIILSNLSSGEQLARALKLGAHKTVLKADLSPQQLVSMVRYEAKV
jgi:two-component system nitrogen regulation response regulator NtrX